MGLSSSTLSNSDIDDHFSAIVNPKRENAVDKQEVHEEDAFAPPRQNASGASKCSSKGHLVGLDARAGIIKRVDPTHLWETFLQGNYMSFALTQSEVTTLLKKSCKDVNESSVGQSDEMDAIVDKEISSYIELVEELSENDFGNPKVIDFMAMCSSTLLLASHCIEDKIDLLYLWITMSQDAESFDFKQFFLAMRSFERGLSHAMGKTSYTEESIRGATRDWFALADPKHVGVADEKCMIDKKNFFAFCSNRQHVVRRLLESLGFSEVKYDVNSNVHEAVINAVENVMNRKPTGGDEWMANPAWKKTAEHMIPKDHTPINNKPTSNLELEWVHGYRGYDCRNNLYYVDQTGSQVFFHTAGLGVVQCDDDNGKKKQYFFGEHTDDVISLDTMDTADCGKLLATGEIGSHPAVCLYEWDAVTKQFLSLTSMRGFHTSGVCQVAFAQDGNSIFTVGAEYTIAIYDSNKNSSKFGKMLGSSQGPKDKVLHCASLPNGNFVSCGEKHISYWNFNGGNIRQDTIKLGSAHKRKLMMCVSHFGEDSYVVGTSGGDILLGSAGKLLDNKLCALKAHKKSVNSIWVHPSGTTMVTGDSSGHIIIWSVDPNSSKILTSVREFEVIGSNYDKLNGEEIPHTETKLPPVRSVCLSHDLKKCLVGTQACEIIEYSIPSGIGFDTKSSENVIPHMLLCGHYKEEVWGLGIRPRGRLDADEETYRTEYCTVGDDGVLRIWDLHSHEQKKFLNLKASARCCAYSPDGQYLAIGFGGSISSRRSKHNGAVRIFRGDTLQQVCEMKEAKQWISAIKFSPDGQALAVGARDNSVYIYSVAQQFKRKSKFSKHNAGILNFDFTSDGKYLQSTCSAYELLFSKTSTGEQVTNGATFLADQNWISQTCTLGWPVIGIWSGSMDGSDVNSTDRSPSGNLIATGDDFGKVNCYKFPCTLPGGAPKNVYSGHSSHVTSVRWVSLAKYAQKKTDDFLISLGGGDKAIMQWKVVGDEHPSSNTAEKVDQTQTEDVADGMTPLGEGPSGGDEFMAVKPWLGTIKAPSAWVAPDVSKKAPFYAALGEMGSKHRTLREIGDKEADILNPPTNEDRKKISPQACDRKLQHVRSAYAEVQSAATTVMNKMCLSGEDNSTQPDGDELELEWVHGFTSDFNNRNELHYVNSSEKEDSRFVVYPAAGLGIVVEMTQTITKQKYFRGHTDDISSLAARDTEAGTMVATGQMGKGNTFVWEVPSMKTLAILKTGQKTVSSLEFSKADNGRLLVSMSPDATICVSDWKSETVLARVKDNTSANAYHLCSSSLASNFSFLACGSKFVTLWNMNGRNLTSSKVSLGRERTGLKFLCSAEVNGVFIVGCEDGLVYNCTRNKSKKAGALQLGVSFCGDGTAAAPALAGKSAKVKSKFKNHVLSLHVDKDNNKLLVGSKNGTLSLFDTTEMTDTKRPVFLRCMKIQDSVENIMAPQIHSISSKSGRIVLSTRGADMIEIESWDSPIAKIITRGHCYNELWGLSTHPALPEYCTTGDDMTLRTYSVTTKTMLSSVPLGAPARACDYNNDGSLIAVGFGGRLGRGKEPKGGMVRLYRGNCGGKETDESTFFDQNHFKGVDVNAKEVLAQVHDAKQWVSVLRFSADGHTLAVGAHDCKIYIYSVTMEEDASNLLCDGLRVAKSASLHLRCTFKKHNSVINHLDLSANGRYMQSNCSAYELLFCDTTTGSQVVNANELKDVPWDSWTCTLGWPVQGIWATGMDGSDINTVSRSSSGHLVATGDDFGKIRLFRYPSISAQSSSLSYSGHSSHVMNVGWTAADECLISCGGNDKCVMQWKHVMTEGTSGAVVKGNHDGEHHDDLYEDDTGDESPMSMGVLGRAPIGGDESGAVKPWLGTVRTPKCAPTVDSSAPAINMNLQWVHGYTSGSSCNTRISSNLRYSSDGSPVYPAAALGVKIVQDQQGGPKSQKFFKGHNDDILCMAIDPARKFVATGQVASKSSRGKGSICIWDVHDCRELCRMDGCHQRAVTSLAFSPDGTQLISIGQDNKNTHKLWTDVGGNWCRVQCTATAVSDQSTVFFSHWLQGNHASECALVSGGAKGINFWQLEGATLVKKQGRFGRKYKQSPLLCAANLQTTDDKGGASCWCAVVGTASGGLFSFGGREITSGVEKAHDGPVLCLAEGNKECTYLVSGGRDHLVRVWNQAMQPISTYNIAKLSICDASIGSLDVRPYIDGLGSQNHDLAFLVGTCGGDIIELSVSPTGKTDDGAKNTLDISNAHSNILMTSHSKGELWGLAVHPTDPDIYATVGDDKTLRIWSVKKQKLLHHTVFTHAARSVAWTVCPEGDSHHPVGSDRNDGPPKELIAVGFMESSTRNQRSRARKVNQVNHDKTDSQHASLHLYKVEFVKGNYQLERIAKGSPTAAWVCSLKFSPVWYNPGEDEPVTIRLGAGSHDKNLYLYDLPNPWSNHSQSLPEESWSDVLVRPDYIYKKHSSAVLNFDFNGNGTSFQSNCQAGELLYGTFINDKVEQETSATKMAQYNGVREVDGDPHFWASQTCTLGWPVQGIWPPGSDTSDINACDRSHKQDLLATVDNFGLVKVFRYPAVDEASKHLQFSGHSSHVTNVRWTLGENLITTGGNDKCVFVWRCEKE